jgi:outer membrane protein
MKVPSGMGLSAFCLHVSFARSFQIAAVFLLASSLGLGAHAQQGIIAVPPDLPNLIGVGFGIAPDYEGSDDFIFGVLPAGQLTFGKRNIRLIGTTLSGNLVDHEYFRFGPSLNYRFGREDVDDEVVNRMSDVDGSVELGAFAGIELINAADPRYRFSASVEFLHDVSGGHEGWVTDISARYWRPLSKPLDFGIGVGLSIGSEDYMTSFFSVNSRDAAASGLSRFDAESGTKDFRVQPMFVFHFSKQWHVGFGFRYKLLIGDAADSPVVDVQGSKNQFLAGLGLIYSW